jgi:hypothetical protein
MEYVLFQTLKEMLGLFQGFNTTNCRYITNLEHVISSQPGSSFGAFICFSLLSRVLQY